MDLKIMEAMEQDMDRAVLAENLHRVPLLHPGAMALQDAY
jgi:hypothetical protein